MLHTSLVPRDPRHDVLFEPIQIGPKTLPNRFIQVPQCCGFGTLKPGSQVEHRSVKAEGGWGAVSTELCVIGPDGDEEPWVLARLWDDHDLEVLAAMAAGVQRHGALAAVELGHPGVHAMRAETRWPAVAPSQVAGDFVHVVPNVPKELERDDIRRQLGEWAAAARLAVEAGFDIVYVHGADSYLPMQFLSRYYNRRSDAYGGSFENRARYWRETLEVVRAAVDGRCAVANRIAVDALGPAGIELSEALEFIAHVDDLVDLWDVNVGSIREWSKNSGPSRFFGEGYQLEWTGNVRQATAKPIVGVGRLTDADRMAAIVRSGVWDVIGGARPSIADPFLPRKIGEGRLEDVRECVGNNQCIARVALGRHIGCTQNATAGEEYRRGWHPERFSRAANADNDVLVLGAGPAGMECAIVLGKRGMRRVHLVDEQDEIGGHMRWVARLPGLGDWGRVTNYRMIQLRKLRNVEIITHTRLSASDVVEYGAEIVVVATGSHWASNGLNGFTRGAIPGADASLPHVLTPEQLAVAGKLPPLGRIAVYDCDGYFMGAAMAERLIELGYEVELITPFRVVAPYCDYTLEGDLLRACLHDLGIAVRRETTVDAVASDHLAISSEFGVKAELACSGVVLVTQRVSDAALYLELAGLPSLRDENGIELLCRIGDCVSPRHLSEAVFDGHRLAREIDSTNPAVPLPFLRETPRASAMTSSGV